MKSNEKSLWRITIDTNPDTCNLNCIMCEDHSIFAEPQSTRKRNGTQRPNMSRTLLERVVREAAEMGVKELIPSTMGEPLLYRHFDLILDLCEELNLKINLTTNGTFPSPDKSKNVEYWAKRIVPIGSDVKISWNGATKETQEQIMPRASLAQHIENTKRFISIRDLVAKEGGNYCKLTMQLTFLELNINEISKMVEMAIELGFDRVKGHHLWAHFDQIKSQSLRKNHDSIKRWNEVVRHCHQIANDHNKISLHKLCLENFFELNPDNVDDIADEGECPFLGHEMWVDPSGRFNVCCAPDQQRKSLGDFGNLEERSVKEIWQSDEYQALCENYMDHTLCQGCNMRKPKAMN
ncbi:radical SAM protein [Shewanella sp. 4_MG-2023]|uniref:radical SAM protein n=1 Tax=Shewanella sp. 4_MG-2023 TaxID=3062652 RepID=UPI0026E11FAE|nr:radical SAM protein [Shewanella sp. 4_MG-2023]MDO6677650.1 radical SAM protein [Shewanella sp. 4_MG-2023]